MANDEYDVSFTCLDKALGMGLKILTHLVSSFSSRVSITAHLALPSTLCVQMANVGLPPE